MADVSHCLISIVEIRIDFIHWIILDVCTIFSFRFSLKCIFYHVICACMNLSIYSRYRVYLDSAQRNI